MEKKSEMWDEGDLKMYEAKYVEKKVWWGGGSRKVSRNVLKYILVLKILKSDKTGKMFSTTTKAHTLKHKDTIVTW